jgi:hypothetical protein
LLWGSGIALAVWIYWEDIRGWTATQPVAFALAVAVVVLLLVLILVTSTRERQTGPGTSLLVPPTVSEPVGSTEPEPPKVYVKEGSPEAVYEIMTALPPHEIEPYYQRAYVGKWVRWEGTVSSITRVGDERIMVSVYREGERWVIGSTVTLSFPAAQESSVKSLTPGDLIRYEGKIYGGYEWPPLISLTKPDVIQVLGRTDPWPPEL